MLLSTWNLNPNDARFSIIQRDVQITLRQEYFDRFDRLISIAFVEISPIAYRIRLFPIQWRNTGIRQSSHSPPVSIRCPRSLRIRPDFWGSESHSHCRAHPNRNSRELSLSRHRDPDADKSRPSFSCPIRLRGFSVPAAAYCFKEMFCEKLCSE